MNSTHPFYPILLPNSYVQTKIYFTGVRRCPTKSNNFFYSKIIIYYINFCYLLTFVCHPNNIPPIRSRGNFMNLYRNTFNILQFQDFFYTIRESVKKVLIGRETKPLGFFFNGLATNIFPLVLLAVNCVFWLWKKYKRILSVGRGGEGLLN